MLAASMALAGPFLCARDFLPTTRLTQTNPVTGEITTFTYDANGNQLTILEPSGDITTNVWDGENRLVEVHHPSGDIVTYAYNGDGLRVWQDDGVDEVRYVHDGNNVLLETDGVGTVEAEFTYIPQTYVEVINVAIIAPRDEPGLSHVMLTRPFADLASRR